MATTRPAIFPDTACAPLQEVGEIENQGLAERG
jgi:hypothetical protein